MRGKEQLPASIGSAILMDAGRKLLADLVESRVDFVLRRLDGFYIFLPNLLLDERAADELIESLLSSERSLADEIGIENGEADFVVNVAGEDGVLVGYGYYAVEDYGVGRV